MKTKFNAKSNLFNFTQFLSLGVLAACSSFVLFQPEAVNSQQSPAISPKPGGLEQQNTINPIDSENPSTLRQNPATLRQDSLRNDGLTAPNSNLPGRGTYTMPRSGSPTESISPSGTQDSMTPSTGGGGSADLNVGGSRRTSPNTGGSGSGPSTDTPANGSTNSTSGTQDSMSPSMGVGGSADLNVGGSRRTSPNTGGSGSGPSTEMPANGSTNSNTDGNVNSTTEMNGTMNNSGSSSDNTSGAVPGLW